MLTLLLIAIPLLMAGAIFVMGSKSARQLALFTGIAELLVTFAAIWIEKSGAHPELLSSTNNGLDHWEFHTHFPSMASV